MVTGPVATAAFLPFAAGLTLLLDLLGGGLELVPRVEPPALPAVLLVLAPQTDLGQPTGHVLTAGHQPLDHERRDEPVGELVRAPGPGHDPQRHGVAGLGDLDVAVELVVDLEPRHQAASWWSQSGP